MFPFAVVAASHPPVALIRFFTMSQTRLPIRVVLFDWDGTLLNSYASDTRAYLAMFRSLNIQWTAREIEQHYSPNWYRVYRAARIPRNKWIEADKLWRKAYANESPSPAARSPEHLAACSHEPTAWVLSRAAAEIACVSRFANSSSHAISK